MADRYPFPASLDEFCRGLCAEMVRLKANVPTGVIWEHGFYGAAQFWEQDCVAKKGWEVSTQHPFTRLHADEATHAHSSSSRILLTFLA